MTKHLAELRLVCSMSVSTLKENGLEHKNLQPIVEEKVHGIFQLLNGLFLLP